MPSWSTREMSSAVHPSTLWPGRSTSSTCSIRAFYRIDYTYPKRTPAVKPGLQLDPSLPQQVTQKSLVQRAGMVPGGWELSVFGNNLTKQESPLAISTIIPNAGPVLI